VVSSRYERASHVVTSNKPSARCGEVLSDDVVAAAMIHQLVHHAKVIALHGDPYRLKDRDRPRPRGHHRKELTMHGVSIQSPSSL
jgi:DNA replication protein DnaC